MTATVPSIELTATVQQQAAQLIAGDESVKEIAQSAFPSELAKVIAEVVRAAANGQTITLSRLPDILTTTEAARQLGISRPTLMKKIERGEIASFKVGSHHRLHAQDVLQYRKSRMQELRDQFAELQKLDEEIF